MTNKFRLTNAKPVGTPMEPRSMFSKEQGPMSITKAMRMRGVPYAEAIGSVLWPAIISRPDVAYAVGVLAQFIKNPGNVHWEALKHIIVYLQSMKDVWLMFGGRSSTTVQGFCDADWGSSPHRHSISGYSFCYYILIITPKIR